ncbi:UNVERIFIED_CONTAM: protein CLT2, chloroplastic [Sesamum radiatum]|uniref:Protein CLT2, chloroplastic n=1 Tax=Sesamum radiatum TaxID=300843 RepID=A0AAW2QES5_SESRA
MELLTPKSSVPSLVSTYVRGSKNGASRIGLIPAGLRLRLQPLRLSVSNVKFAACKNDFDCRKNSIVPRFQHLIPSAIAKSSSDAGPPSSYRADKRLAVVTWAAITLVIAVGNRVLQKLALVPMKDHPFFLAQFNSFMYVAVYFSVLHFRYRAGLTTDEMLAVPKAPFIVIGLLESISMVSGIHASRTSYTLIIPSKLLSRHVRLEEPLARLPNDFVNRLRLLPALVSLSQPVCADILGVAADIFQNPVAENLHTEPNLRMLSCGSWCRSGGHEPCLANILFPAGSGSANTRMLSGVGLLWPALMIASSAFQAVASIVKALFVLLFLPILSNLKGIPLSELPSIFKSGAACFLNIGTNTTACDGAPLLPLLYIISNLLFNISILNLLKVSDAIVASLAARSAVFSFSAPSALPRTLFPVVAKSPMRLSYKAGICRRRLFVEIFDYRKTTFIRFQHLVPCALAKSSSPDGPPSSDPSADKKLAVVVWTAITMVLAVGDRVLHKLALVPMKDYPLFLAQFNSFVYVAVYFPVLHVRYHAGLTTDEMLAIPKAPFVVIGLLESISMVSGMYAGAMLPGPAIPLLYQTFLVWQLIFSRIILRRSYRLNQIVGCFLVAAGVIVGVTSGSANSRMLSGVGLFWPALMISSCAFQAVASIVKEFIFIDAATRIKGKSLDIFVVHSFGSGFQALFVLLLLPILSNLKGVPLSEVPSYYKSAAACFLNVGTNTTGCDGAPLLPILYIISNLLFKISNLNLLKVSNAIVASLAVRSSVPIAIYLLSLPLPYLPKGVSLSPFFHLGSVILVLGLILYNIPWPWKQTC